jgi:hypothetical protein
VSCKALTRFAALPALATIVLSGLAAISIAAHAGQPRLFIGSWSHATRATTTTAVADPAHNIDPDPDYWPTCQRSGASSTNCINAVVAAINNARSLEGVAPMTLPAGFAQMSPAVQTYVVSNLERVDRGLTPVAGMVDSLNAAAQSGADANADPRLSSWTVGSFSADRWGSIWAGDLNALAADYDWMYDDGWGPAGSFNLDCADATASGCWGHRDNILSSYGGEELITGVASNVQAQWTSIAQLFVAGQGEYPVFTVSWADVSGPTTATSTTPPDPTGTVDPTTHNPAAGGATTVDPTASSLAVSRTIVVRGRPVTLTGTVLDVVTGLPLAGARVQVCAITRTGPRRCADGVTDADGHVVATALPTMWTKYWLRFAGNSGATASRSAAHAVRVVPRRHR